MRDHHSEHTARPNPSPDVLQEQGLHPSILAFTDLEVIGRIQVQERIRLDRGMRVKGAALDHKVEDPSRFLRSIGVELYRMARGGRGLGEDRERGTGAGARVKNAR